MNIYWTKKVIIKYKKIFFRGQFTGKFYANRSVNDVNGIDGLYKIHIYESNVTFKKEDTRTNEQGDFKEVDTLQNFGATFNVPIKCSDSKNNKHFLLNTQELLLADPKLSHIVNDGDQHFGTITGTLYFSVTKLFQETKLLKHYRRNNNTKNREEPQFEIISDVGKEQNTLAQQSLRSKPLNWLLGCQQIFIGLLSVFFFLLFLLVIIASWQFILGLVIIAAFFFLIYHIKAVWFTRIFRFLFLIGLVLVIASLLNYFSFHHFHYASRRPLPITSPPVILPTDTIHTQRLDTAQGKTGGDTTKTLVETDKWITHFRKWSDLRGEDYSGTIKVRYSFYQAAQKEHSAYPDYTPLPQIYAAFAKADEKRLTEIYKLFDRLKEEHHSTNLQFANMIVSFVQSLRYSSVQSGICGEGYLYGNSNIAKTDCIGNIGFGVQSPIEFMGNLKGDCDTRTVFLFTVLNHYHFQVAILGSPVFHHSLLGIELPVNGSSKTLGIKRYVLWETTSTGFNLGKINSSIDNMDYWNFDLINLQNYE